MQPQGPPRTEALLHVLDLEATNQTLIEIYHRLRTLEQYHAWVPFGVVNDNSDTTTSTSYVPLDGPELVDVPPGPKGLIRVDFGAALFNSGSATSRMAIQVEETATGSIVFTPDDEDAIWNFGTDTRRFFGMVIVRGLNPQKKYTVKAMYKVGAGTGTFVNRRLIMTGI